MAARKAIWAGGQEGIPLTECLLTPPLCKEKEPTVQCSTLQEGETDGARAEMAQEKEYGGNGCELSSNALASNEKQTTLLTPSPHPHPLTR